MGRMACLTGTRVMRGWSEGDILGKWVRNGWEIFFLVRRAMYSLVCVMKNETLCGFTRTHTQYLISRHFICDTVKSPFCLTRFISSLGGITVLQRRPVRYLTASFFLHLRHGGAASRMFVSFLVARTY